MPEVLSHSVVSQELARLVQAFPSARRNLSELAEVYRSGLVGISPHALHVAVDRVIQDDQFFPKVSRLRQLAGDYAKSHPSPFAPSFPSDNPDICPICGAQANPRMIPKLKDGGNPNKREDWEEVVSRSTYTDHDPARHRHVFKNDE